MLSHGSNSPRLVTSSWHCCGCPSAMLMPRCVYSRSVMILNLRFLSRAVYLRE